jgi:hypothetical protein
MSSIELVSVINEMREYGQAELRHDNFMAKIEKHPGIDSPKFLGQYKDSTGRMLKCYHLPKRECELMVMSESLAVQARVYDKMTALEARAVTAPKPAATSIPAAKEFRALFGICRLIGLDKNVSAISANQGVLKLTGTNMLQLLGSTYLENPEQKIYLTPTEIGLRLGSISGRRVNMLLAEAGLQAKQGDKWVPLNPAEGLFKILDTGKAHADGAMVQQVKWSSDVIDLIHQPKELAKEAA